MNRYLSNVSLVISFVLTSIGSSSAQGLTVAERCAIDWAKATAAYVKCLTRAQIKGVKKDLSEEDVNWLKSRCEAENSLRFAKAEARAARKGGQCATTGDVAKPKIPIEDFEWKGTFKVDSLEVETDLTIRGKWQDGSFDLYMQQGHEGSNQKVWVENLIYKNRLYIFTHEWPPSADPGFPLVGACVKTVNPVTVTDLNAILASSRLVGREIIDGMQMNHFRTTCLSQTFGLLQPDPDKPKPLAQLHVFSDIYVQPGRSDQFERWLQSGDGVGLDPQQDEWFFFEERNDHPDEIKLPEKCKSTLLLVVQDSCSNL